MRLAAWLAHSVLGPADGFPVMEVLRGRMTREAWFLSSGPGWARGQLKQT